MQCEAGLLSVTGTPEIPAKAGISVADIAAGMYAYSGILAALYERERTGEGTSLDVAMLDALGEWMGQPFYYSVYGGQPASRTGARHASISPYGPYAAAGGDQVFLGLQNEREWAVLCEKIPAGRNLVADDRFATNPDRVAHDDELTPIIEAALAAIPAEDLAAALDEAGIANARLRTPAEFAAHPQLRARGRWREVDTPGGPIRALLPPVNVPGREAVMGAVPALGQHTGAIRAELGLATEAASRRPRPAEVQRTQRSHQIVRTSTIGRNMTAPSQARPHQHPPALPDGHRRPAGPRPSLGRRYETVNPFTGRPWATAADADADDVDLAVRAARGALSGPWSQITGFGRAKLMRKVGDLIARDADYLAGLETRDTGKLAREMRDQLAVIPEWFYYYAGLADKLEGSTIPTSKPNFLVYTRREPVGVVGAIVPWNSPMLLLCWKLAPALAAGLHGRGQAQRLHPGLHRRTRGAGRGGGCSGRGVQRRDRLRPGGGQGPGRAPRRGQDRFHRIHPGRSRGRPGGRGEHHRDRAGAGRQVRARGVRRRRPGRGLQRGRGRRLRRHRADLHGRVPAAGQPQGPRPAGRKDHRPGADDQGRRPGRHRDRDGPAGQPAAVREGAVVPVLRAGPGGHGRRGRAARRRARRLLRAAYGADRRQPGDDGRLRGSVRAGAGRDPLRHRGRGDRAGQRHPVRAAPARCGPRTSIAATGLRTR